MLVPGLESEPVFNEEHSCCESWTVGAGATRASKIVSILVMGRAPDRPQLEVSMMGLVEDPGALRHLAIVAE